MGLVKRGSDEVVHGGVGNDEGLFAVAFDGEHAGHQRPGLGYEKAAGLDEQAAVEAGQRVLNGSGVLRYLGGCVKCAAVIVDAQAAASIHNLEQDAFAPELLDQLADPLMALPKG